MARNFQIDTPAKIGGLLTANSGLTVNGTTTLGRQATSTTHAVRADRTLTGGTGIKAIGNLTQDRTISFDTDWGDGRYAPLSHVGTGGAAHALATTSAHGFMASGDKSKLNAIEANAINKATADGLYVPLTRSISTGDGLTGGGNLTANRTLSFDTAWGDNRYSLTSHNHDTRYVRKSGDTLTGPLSINATGTAGTERPYLTLQGVYANDETNEGGGAFIRFSTSTSDGFGGEVGAIRGPSGSSTLVFKTNSTSTNSITTRMVINPTGNVGIGTTSPSHLLDVSGTARVSSALTLGTQASATTHAVRADRTISSGTGLTGGGNLTANRTLSFDTAWGDARYALSGHTHNYANNSLTLTAGTGLTGGGNLTANRTFAFDTTWGDNRYALSDHGHSNLTPTSRTITAGTGLTGGGSLASNRTISLDVNYTDNRYLRADGTATLSGDLTVNGVAKLRDNVYQVTFAAGEDEKTISHSLGTANFAVTLGANSVARHVAWNNKTSSNVTIQLDSPYHGGPIVVDVILLPF